MVRPAGFEPAAFGTGNQRSIQLSYGRIPLSLPDTGRFFHTLLLTCYYKMYS
jgi:hypothetical protein